MDLNIKSDTVDKAIEIIEDSTKETRNALDQKTSRGINKLFDLLKSTPIGIKAEVYIQERPYKLKLAMDEMKKKYENIPQVNRTEPSSYIALKGVNELNYCLDEDYLKEMFENLLVSDMDTRKQGRVLPAYIEIIKQLSKADADFLKLLYNNDSGVCSISLKLSQVGKSGYSELDEYIIYNYSQYNNSYRYLTLKLNPLTIDNLLMHRLIETNYILYYTYSDALKQYDILFDDVKTKYKVEPNNLLTYDKGFVRLTELGKNFIDICLS